MKQMKPESIAIAWGCRRFKALRKNAPKGLNVGEAWDVNAERQIIDQHSIFMTPQTGDGRNGNVFLAPRGF
jgi:hypothetical protein